MKQILVTRQAGTTELYEHTTIPFSNCELERLVKLYYNNLTCERCRNAVLQNGFARLIIEAEDNASISIETLSLFPILNGYKSIEIKQKKK